MQIRLDDVFFSSFKVLLHLFGHLDFSQWHLLSPGTSTGKGAEDFRWVLIDGWRDGYGCRWLEGYTGRCLLGHARWWGWRGRWMIFLIFPDITKSTCRRHVFGFAKKEGCWMHSAKVALPVLLACLSNSVPSSWWFSRTKLASLKHLALPTPDHKYPRTTSKVADNGTWFHDSFCRSTKL